MTNVQVWRFRIRIFWSRTWLELLLGGCCFCAIICSAATCLKAFLKLRVKQRRVLYFFWLGIEGFELKRGCFGLDLLLVLIAKEGRVFMVNEQALPLDKIFFLWAICLNCWAWLYPRFICFTKEIGLLLIVYAFSQIKLAILSIPAFFRHLAINY